jgi:hypothetical protein
MSLTHDAAHDDQHLVRYVLGLLPEDQTEFLDEASIADDELAARLVCVENDLIDTYVRGALSGALRERFESHYLGSPIRRERVNFARRFIRTVDAEAARGDSTPEEQSTPTSPTGQPGPVAMRLLSLAGGVGRRKPIWRVAAAAALLVAVCGTLAIEIVRLSSSLDATRRESIALERRTRMLEQQLADQRAAKPVVSSGAEPALDSVAVAPPTAAAAPKDPVTTPRPQTIALVLLPQTRSIMSIPTFAVPSGALTVAIELRLEANDFARYQVGLKDPATNRIVWRSAWMAARTRGTEPSVRVTLPARVLNVQHYTLDVMGEDANGGVAVGSYAFEIVPR